MKKILFIIVLISLTHIYAVNLSNIQASFLDIGYGARPMGMGGAYTAIADNALSMVWNPAGQCLSHQQNSICFDNVSMLGLYNYSFLGFSHQLPYNNALGAGILYSGDEAMSETQIILSGSVSKEYLDQYLIYSPIHIGMNLKLLLSSFGNNADGAYIDDNGLNHQVKGNAAGFALDLGFQYPMSKTDFVGLLWRNPISSITWKSENEVNTAQGTYNEDLPAGLVFGYSRIVNKLTFSIDLDKSLHADTEDLFKTGGEYLLFNDLMALRAGYSQEMLTGKNKRYSLGTGFNLNVWNKSKVNFDIAYQIETNWEKHNNLRISCEFLM